MRIILDNNVAISALIIENSISHKAYRKAVEKHILFISEEVIIELITRLKRQKFSRYFVNEIIKEELILAYLDTCQKIKVNHRISACRDPDDDKYLELALSSKADLIISGDHDLLVLSPFNEIHIINPSDFLNRYP